MTNTIFSSQQKESIFMNMSDGVITLDTNQQITYMNPAGEAIFNLEADNCVGQKIFDCLIQSKYNRSLIRLIQNALKANHKSDNSIIKYDNGDIKKVLNVRISRVKKNGSNAGIMILIEDITASHTLKKHERDCAMTFAGLITCICIYLSAWSLIRFTLGIHLKTSVYTLMIEGIAFILFLEIIFCTSMTPKDIGIFARPSKLFQTFKQSIPLAAIACSIMVVINLLLRLSGHPVKPYFMGGSWTGAYTYIFTAILQEFLSRGVMQTSVKSLMKIKYQKFFTIFLTSLLFALMHLPFDFPFMVGAFLLSIALGIIYEKQQNIWGCAFLHWSCGYVAMAMFF